MKKRFLTIGTIIGILIIASVAWVAISNSGEKGRFLLVHLGINPVWFGYVEPTGMPTPEETLSYAAKAIEDGDIKNTLKMFDEDAHDRMKDLLNQLDSRGRERLAESLRNATLDTEAEAPPVDNFRTYKTKRLVNGLPEGSSVTVHFYMITLRGGNWVILNL